ncbi:hypothetical protein FNV43_RR00501 [Rhamnella rubrinervis]|uniref:Uncharacterized protein n=1 Tax=Rhamnella rubrinervis TaxID=2594499 RepID=A0A8K0HPA9_9ROSA|nr:hypothetical protein FNV43_RR00501 [Rhamnella rubrinervis]
MKEKTNIEGQPMTTDEIFDIVLPPRSGYVRGCGSSPKPPSKAHRVAEKQFKEVEERAKANRCKQCR